MGKTSAPPLDGEAIRQARIGKFMSQQEVAEQVAALCAPDGIKFDRSGLSYIENETVKRPSLKVVRALSQVLEIEDSIFKAESGSEDEDAEADDAGSEEQDAAQEAA